MATPAPHERPDLSSAIRLELDFGDTDLVVREFSDGMWTVAVDGEPLLVNTDQMQRIVGGFLRLGKEKGWT